MNSTLLFYLAFPLVFACALGWILKPWMAAVLTVLAVLAVGGIYAAIFKGAESSVEGDVRARYAAALENAHPVHAADWKDAAADKMSVNMTWYVGLGLMLLPLAGPWVLAALWCGVILRSFISPRKKKAASADTQNDSG
ncbi:MAG: hypothetical protein QM760_20225 [Nibricoccus sp.]